MPIRCAMRLARYGLCMVCMALFGCAEKSGSGESIEEIHRREGVPVRCMTVQRITLRAIETGGGTAEGILQADLSASVPGVISSVRVSVGSTVRKNAVVMTVNPDMASPYTMAKTQYDNAKRARERIKALADEGAVSQETIEQVEAGYTMAAEQLKAAKNVVNIVSPFEGTIIEIMERKNSKVGPGQELARVARLDTMRIELEINEGLISRYAQGLRAFLLIEGDTLWGRITKVAIGASGKTHAFPVTAVFPNQAGAIRPGMFLTVHVVTDERDSVVVISPETVIMEEEKAFIYVVEGDAAAKKSLTLGLPGTDGFEVLEGLSEGDRVVVSGAALLSDGVRVKVIQ